MNEPSSGHCLYAVVFAPREHLEGLLLDAFAPLLREFHAARELESLFFVRFSEPNWQLRVRVLGEHDWIEGPVRPRVRECLESLAREGRVESFTFARYDREWERYGGSEGMRLAERLFTLDSMAMLDLMALERRGALARSRREWALILVQCMIEGAGLGSEEQLAFYRRGYEWALGPEGWDSADLEALDRKFESQRAGLAALLGPGRAVSREALWGGAEAAGIAERFLANANPVLLEILDGCRNGRIAQSPTYLLWSYAHMLTNRLGIESTAEAILRYFMHRLLDSRAAKAD